MKFWLTTQPLPMNLIPPVCEQIEQKGWTVRDICMIGSITLSKLTNAQSPAMVIFASQESDKRPEPVSIDLGPTAS